VKEDLVRKKKSRLKEEVEAEKKELNQMYGQWKNLQQKGNSAQKSKIKLLAGKFPQFSTFLDDRPGESSSEEEEVDPNAPEVVLAEYFGKKRRKSN
jgi:hypothetical protein